MSFIRIKKTLSDDDIQEMNIPIFRGNGCGEKVHRYDVTYQLLLMTELMKNMRGLKGMDAEYRE